MYSINNYPEKRIFKISIGNLSKEDSEKLIRELTEKWKDPRDFPDFYWREIERKELRKKRIEKLNKLW